MPRLGIADRIMLLLAHLLLASAALTAQAPLPGYEPVPDSQLTAGVLRIPEANCTVPSPPGPTWRWYVKRTDGHSVAYLCRDSTTGTVLSIMAHPFPATAVRPAFLAAILEGMKAEASRLNRELLGLRQTTLAKPIAGTVRFSYSLASRGATTTHVFTYAVPTGVVCMFTAFAPTPAEPAMLSDLVRGLRLLRVNRPEEMFPDLATVVSPFTPLALALFTYGGVVAVSLLRRRRISPWRPLAVAFALAAAFNMFVLKRHDILEDLALQDRNRLLLRSLAVPVLGAAFAISRRERSHPSSTRPAGVA